MDQITSDAPRASFAGSNTSSSSASSSAQSDFAAALSRETQSSSSSGQNMTADPRMPTPREQAAQQSLPSGRQTSTSTSGEQLYLSDQLTQRVRATRSGPGFDKQLNRDMTKASDAFGPGGKTDVCHPDDKPFGLTRAGEESDVRPGSSSANRSAGATRDKAAIADARSNGEFARTDGTDVSAPRGGRSPQPGKSEWRGPVSEWEGSVPARSQSSTAAPIVESPPMSVASPQLKLPNICEPPPSAPAALSARPASTPPATPPVSPQVAPRGGPGPSVLEGIAGRLGGAAAVVGGILSTKTFADDLEMHDNPSSPRLGPVGTHRIDSQGREWIKLTPDYWELKGAKGA